MIAVAQKFWMVWCWDTQKVTKQHMNRTDALNEARRLANIHHKHVFYVLESHVQVGPVYTLDTPITIREFLELPDDVVKELSRELRERITTIKEAAADG